jgi:hypothetical protein
VVNRFVVIDSKNALDVSASCIDHDGMAGNDQRSRIGMSVLRLLGEPLADDEMRLIVVRVEVDDGNGWMDNDPDSVGVPLDAWLARRQRSADGQDLSFAQVDDKTRPM